VYNFGDETGMRGLANKLGLRHVGKPTHDVFVDEIGELPDLPLLEGVQPDWVRDLMFGRINDANVEIFNLALPQYEADPRSPARSCVVHTFLADFPTLTLRPHTPMSRLRASANWKLYRTMAPEFKERFDISAREPERCEIILDHELTHWLVKQRDDLRIEMRGGALVGHVPEIPDSDIVELVEVVGELHARIPDAAWTTFSPFGNLG
jgi:hypothetical protein